MVELRPVEACVRLAIPSICELFVVLGVPGADPTPDTATEGAVVVVAVAVGVVDAVAVTVTVAVVLLDGEVLFSVLGDLALVSRHVASD